MGGKRIRDLCAAARKISGTMNPNPKHKPIRLKGKAYTKFRKAVHDRALGRCESCGCYAPLLVDGCFDVFTCGHVSHIVGRGAGGSDTLDNAKWECHDCHILGKHGPQWQKTSQI